MAPSEDLSGAPSGAEPDALFVMDKSGQVLFVNEQVEHLFGWPSDAIVGQNFGALVAGQCADTYVPGDTGACADGLQLSSVGRRRRRLRARRRDESEFSAEIDLTDLDGVSGSSVVLAAVRDLTAGVAPEAVLRQPEFAKDYHAVHGGSPSGEGFVQLVDGVAHDISNMLGVILNYATLLSRGLTDSLALADVGEIRTAAERTVTLTRQLSTFARLDVNSEVNVEVNVEVNGPVLLRSDEPSLRGCEVRSG